MPTVVSVFGVEPFRIGGTETFARELSLQLGRLGWKSVLCFQTEPPPQVRRFLDLPNVFFEVVGDTTKLSWKSTKPLAGVLRRHRPDVLHLHFTGFLGIYPWLARLFSTKRVFFTDHTSRPAGYVCRRAPFWKRRLARLINWPVTKVICVSSYGYDCMTSLGLLPKERHELVYNAVDLSRVCDQQQRGLEFKQKYSIPGERIVVVQVSWIIPEKGIPDLLRAAHLVVSRNQNVQFVLVGEGAYREQYMKDADELGLGDHVTWTGLIEDPFEAGVYNAADIVCQVSQWEEVFGWMIAEGMAHGKPIVASRVGGIPELVSDNESGFLVERGNTAKMAEKILTLIDQPELRQQMGSNGRKAAETRFNLEKNVAQLLPLYGQLMT